jgi:hypothetical protein
VDFFHGLLLLVLILQLRQVVLFPPVVLAASTMLQEKEIQRNDEILERQSQFEYKRI